MWTLISCAREGDNWSSHKEFLLDSPAEIYLEPTDQGEIAPGSLAYTQGFGIMWMKNQDGSWSEITTEDPMAVVTDVKINGTSIVTEGVANIPLATSSTAGACQLGVGLTAYSNKINVIYAGESDISSRTGRYAFLSATQVDSIVKAGMTDGTGAAWTAEEKTAAMNRIGCPKDIQINGTSIVSEGVANIPLATDDIPGVVVANPSSGLEMAYGKYIRISRAMNQNIDNRNHSFKPIVPSNLDYAVKKAMCDGIGEAWTQAEKNGAKERLGLIGGWTEFGTYTYTREEADPDPINVDLTGYHELCFVSDVTGTNTSNFRFIIGSNSFNTAIGLCINGQRKAVFFVRESPAKLIAYDYTYGDNTGSGTLNSVGTTFKYPFNENWANTLDQINAFTFATPANVTSYTIKVYAR